jgi:hypothetical protein
MAKMLDLPHSAVLDDQRPTYSIIEERPLNPAYSWVRPFLDSEKLSLLSNAENQIEELSRLEENWDGYGGIPIKESTKLHSLAALRGILLAAPNPEITPNPNGTLSFEWETQRGVAHLEIGQTKMSFYLKPRVGDAIFIDANASDMLLNSIKIGILVSAHLFPLQHGTTSITKIGLAANVSPAY